MDLPARIGKYQIHGMLGKGGMSIVYQGFDPAIARRVAIKAITKSRLAKAEIRHVMERFRHEAQAVGRLTHPRIVQIYDYGEDDDIAYIVMELVQGRTLAQHLMQETRFEIQEIGAIVSQLLDGIGHAHREGVIHRDIKPSNIMINAEGAIKIGDFGIARIDSSNLTRAGDVLGTPHYMAPEQFLGAETDTLADLYSIGVIAYEIATGRKPFTGNSATIMQKVLNERPPQASLLNPWLSPLVDRVLERALAKKREDRFQSAPEFAGALQEAVSATVALRNAEPITNPPDGAALLSAARLLNAAPPRTRSQRTGTPPPISQDSAISLDNSVKKARMLIVDDEVRILTALKSLFRSRYHVFTTTDGHKALDFLRRYPMHVIVCDQRMPDILGVELLRRSRGISPNSVRILLTGYSDLAAIVGSINDGEVYRFISKPWDNNDLQTIMAEAVTIALELADARVAPAELPAQMDAGVLVIDDDEEIFRVVRELLGSLCPVAYAASARAARTIMQSREIGVVVTDIEAGHENLVSMLRMIRQEHPQILSIVATNASDSELVIELINQAQIFRFLNKPVNVRLLKNHVLAALRCYLNFKQAPRLMRAHQVSAAAASGSSYFGQRLLASLKSLPARWFGAGGH
jgi:serine/threonine-protein kinase